MEGWSSQTLLLPANFMFLQANNMRESNGHRPANLDLFLRLDDLIRAKEHQNGIAICFWLIPRSYNKIADELAEKGAKETLAVRNRTIN
jgi:hypothetical protein